MSSKISYKIVNVVNIVDCNGNTVDVSGTMILDIWKHDNGKLVISTFYDEYEYLVALSSNGETSRISMISSWRPMICRNGENCNVLYCNSLLCKGRNPSRKDLMDHITKIEKNGFSVKLNISEEFKHFIMENKTREKPTQFLPEPSPKKVESKTEKKPIDSSVLWSDVVDEDQKSSISSVSVSATTVLKLEEKFRNMELENNKRRVAKIEDFEKIGRYMKDEEIVDYWREWFAEEESYKQQKQKITNTIKTIQDAEDEVRKAEEKARELAEMAQKLLE